MALRIPRKLIEVALPLDDINEAAIREKSIRHGHPNTLHLWWARRPLAAARAVLFAQLVNDPGGQRGWGAYPGQTKEMAHKEREELFDIIRDLVKWENINDASVLKRAKKAIHDSWLETCELNKGVAGFAPSEFPAFHDPFSGGGTIPLEAQRLGMTSYAADLNPVAVLINKAMVELPSFLAGQPPIGPEQAKEKQVKFLSPENKWPTGFGLAEDVRRYGRWMFDEAKKQIGHHYPQVTIGNKQRSAVAWLWARTVKSPDPSMRHVDVPLISSYYLCNKVNKKVWLDPVVVDDEYSFNIEYGTPDNHDAVATGTKTGRAYFKCIITGTPITPSYIKTEGMAGRIGSKLLAVIVEEGRSKIYIPSDDYSDLAIKKIKSDWEPAFSMSTNTRHMTPVLYGLDSFEKLFNNRQLLALNTFSGLVSSLFDKVEADYKKAFVDAGFSTEELNTKARKYASAIATYMAFAVDKGADYWSNLCTWAPHGEYMGHVFTEKAMQMVWDYAEANPFSDSTGSWLSHIDWVARAVEKLPANAAGFAVQNDATQSIKGLNNYIVSTDPPYYDNVPYADISDFFYVWLRKSLSGIYPEIFGTILVPKMPEIVADERRHGGKEKANNFFMNTMSDVLYKLTVESHPAFPVTIYYAFKQSDTKDLKTASSGWEAFLAAVIKSGFAITGTWPLNTELKNRRRGIGSNALASSILLVCQRRDAVVGDVSRREFLRELRESLPESLEAMIGGSAESSPVPPVDLAQSAIGPGMAIFSRYNSVLEADGSTMSVHTALTVINKEIDAFFFTAEGDLDAESRFCLAWFDQYGWTSNSFGDADVLARAKGTSVASVQLAGGLEANAGKVRLLRPTEYPNQWHPTVDARTSAWEALHHLIRVLKQSGETPTGILLAAMPSLAESVRQLAYRLYTHCERMGRAEDARAYNELIIAWPALQEVVQAQPVGVSQTSFAF